MCFKVGARRAVPLQKAVSGNISKKQLLAEKKLQQHIISIDQLKSRGNKP
jgi:hypothetical protein